MPPNYIKLLLNLEDVFVANIQHEDDWIKVFLQTKAKPQICPACGCTTKRTHDYRLQTIKLI